MSIESEPSLSRRAVMRGAVMLGVGAGIGVPMLSSTPASAQVTSPTIYGRSAWGARPPRGTVNIIGNRPNKLSIHRTASANQSNQSNTSQAAAFALSRSIQSYHMDSNRWIDAGSSTRSAAAATSWRVARKAYSGRFSASGSWGTWSFSSDRYGADYRFADPVLASDAAWYRVNIPSSGTYLVDAWWPANSGYNNSTPYVIATSSGSQTVNVSQRTNGGGWVNLGSFPLAAGDYNVVGVSRWTSGTGYVIAEAIRVRN